MLTKPKIKKKKLDLGMKYEFRDIGTAGSGSGLERLGGAWSSV